MFVLKWSSAIADQSLAEKGSVMAKFLIQIWAAHTPAPIPATNGWPRYRLQRRIGASASWAPAFKVQDIWTNGELYTWNEIKRLQMSTAYSLFLLLWVRVELSYLWIHSNDFVQNLEYFSRSDTAPNDNVWAFSSEWIQRYKRRSFDKWTNNNLLSNWCCGHPIRETRLDFR